MLPVEIQAHIVVPVPVDPRINGGGTIGPVSGIGEAACEYLVAYLQVGNTAVDFNRSRIQASVIPAKRPLRFGQVDAASDLLASHKISTSHAPAPQGHLDALGTAHADKTPCGKRLIDQG